MTFPGPPRLDAWPTRAIPESVPRDEPFPYETVRDLIGIARALFLAFRTMGPEYTTHMGKVASIGSQLQRAMEKARKGGPGTWNHTTAWIMAEQAATDLGTLVDKYLPASLLIRATGQRLARRG